MSQRSFGVGSYIHVYNRGAKKLPIYREEDDLHRLLANLYYLNHSDRMPENWRRELEMAENPKRFQWLDTWGDRKPIVSILAFKIMPNHLHLLMREIVEGGTSRFMHRVSMAYSKFINEKYSENGSLFQGTFKSRTIEQDADLHNLAVYVMIKNAFELYPGGLRRAIENFDDAYERAVNDPFNSLSAYAGSYNLPIVTKDLLGDLFETPDSFKEFARESMMARLEQLTSDFD